jgi:hypothetical protein
MLDTLKACERGKGRGLAVPNLTPVGIYISQCRTQLAELNLGAGDPAGVVVLGRAAFTAAQPFSQCSDAVLIVSTSASVHHTCCLVPG